MRRLAAAVQSYVDHMLGANTLHPIAKVYALTDIVPYTDPQMSVAQLTSTRSAPSPYPTHYSHSEYAPHVRTVTYNTHCTHTIDNWLAKSDSKDIYLSAIVCLNDAYVMQYIDVIKQHEDKQLLSRLKYAHNVYEVIANALLEKHASKPLTDLYTAAHESRDEFHAQLREGTYVHVCTSQPKYMTSYVRIALEWLVLRITNMLDDEEVYTWLRVVLRLRTYLHQAPVYRLKALLAACALIVHKQINDDCMHAQFFSERVHVEWLDLRTAERYMFKEIIDPSFP